MNRFVHHRRRRAFTLVEVLAGIALLSGLLTSVVIGLGKHRIQIRRAAQKLDAVEATDRLLRNLTTDGPRVSPSASGMLQVDSGWLEWQTSTTEIAFGSTTVQQVHVVVWDPMHTDRGSLVEVDVLQSGDESIVDPVTATRASAAKLGAVYETERMHSP